jgi:hypothetical protein
MSLKWELLLEALKQSKKLTRTILSSLRKKLISSLSPQRKRRKSIKVLVGFQHPRILGITEKPSVKSLRANHCWTPMAEKMKRRKDQAGIR